MKTQYVSVAIVLVGFILTPIRPAVAQLSLKAQLTPDDRKLFQWFDSLEFAKFTHLPFIRVETGPGGHILGEEPENHIEYGFLIRDSKKEFSYWDLALEKNIRVKKTKDIPANYRVNFKKYKIDVAAAELIAQIETENEKQWEDRVFMDRMGETISHSCEVFVLARACFQQNKNQAAANLLKLAKTLSDENRDVSLGDVSLKKGLTIDLAHSLFWRTVLKFDDPKIPFTEIADDLTKLQKHFPQSSDNEEASSMLSLVKQMISEETKRKPVGDLNSLSIDQQVAEWIYQLRNQDGKQMMQPGACDIFYYDSDFYYRVYPEEKRRPPSPAKRLVDIGLPAVPQLIKALDDTRFTRSVGYHRDFYFSHRVLRIGECARSIIDAISGRAVWSDRYANKEMPGETDFADRANRWFADITAKGERQLLVELTKTGDGASPDQAERLAQKFPMEALAVIKQATQNAETEWVANQLIDVAAEMGKSSVPFLEEQLKTADSKRLRIAIADHLYAWNPELRSATLIEEFEKSMARSDEIAKLFNQFRTESNDALETHFDDIEILTESMLYGNSPTIAKYIADHFEEWPLVVRLTLLHDISNDNRLRWENRAKEKDEDLYDVPFTAEVKAEFERLFIATIEDPIQFSESIRTPVGYGFDSYRWCDFALEELSMCLPDEYEYSETGSFYEKEKQRIAAINHFRRKNKLESIPALVPAKPDPRNEKRAQSNLDRIVATMSAAQRSVLLKQYQSELGEDGLSSILGRLKTLPRNHSAFSDLNTLAKTISCTVVKITNVGKNLAPNDLTSEFEKLKGKRLNSEMIKRIFLDYLDQPDKNSTGFFVSIKKGEMNQGLRVEYAMTKTFSPKSGESASYTASYTVRVNGKAVEISESHGHVDSDENDDMFDEFIEAAHDAFEESPEKTFAVNFLLRRSK